MTNQQQPLALPAVPSRRTNISAKALTTKLTPSQRLSRWTHEAERIFNHLLGYALAVCGLIAIADVVAGQRMSSQAPWLFWAWVLVQGLGIDFQILTLLRRMPKLWRTNRWVFFVNVVFILMLVVMLVIIGSVFVEHDTTNTANIEAAMASIGISHQFFVWLRSIMTALLIVIFGIDRAIEVAEHEQQDIQGAALAAANTTIAEQSQLLEEQRTQLGQTAQAQHAQGEQLARVQVMLAEVRNTLAQVERERALLAEHLEHTRAAQQEVRDLLSSTNAPDEGGIGKVDIRPVHIADRLATGPLDTPIVQHRTNKILSLLERETDAEHCAVASGLAAEQDETGTGPIKASAEQSVRAALAALGTDATGPAIAAFAGCSETAAKKWKQRILAEAEVKSA